MICAIAVTKQQHTFAPSSVFIPDLAVGGFTARTFSVSVWEWCILFLNRRSNCERTCSMTYVHRPGISCRKPLISLCAILHVRALQKVNKRTRNAIMLSCVFHPWKYFRDLEEIWYGKPTVTFVWRIEFRFILVHIYRLCGVVARGPGSIPGATRFSEK
jgi:hypothetical protein